MSDSTPTVYDLNKSYAESPDKESNDSISQDDVFKHIGKDGMSKDLSLSAKMTDDEFIDISFEDTILFDTPIEGAKAGEVMEMEETWSGIMSATVDTGVSQYSITPLQDEFSAEYIGKISDTVSLSQELLGELEAATITDLSRGDVVVLDCPHIGATIATVADCKPTTNQGLRATFETENVYFVSYEKPSPIQTREQPYLVGRQRE